MIIQCEMTISSLSNSRKTATHWECQRKCTIVEEDKLLIFFTEYDLQHFDRIFLDVNFKSRIFQIYEGSMGSESCSTCIITYGTSTRYMASQKHQCEGETKISKWGKTNMQYLDAVRHLLKLN